MKIATIVIMLLVAMGCARTAREGNGSAVKAAAPVAARVPMLKLEAQPFNSVIEITGTLVSNAQVDVKAETTGKVIRFPKQEGEHVEAAEAVVWVDEENYQLNLRQAQGSVQVAEAALERARVLAAHSRSELERANNLLASGGITDRDLKAAQLTDQDAKAQVVLAEAQLEQARVAVSLADKHRRDTVIRAPVSGEIQKRYVNPGAYVEPPTPVFALVDNQRLELECQVPASEIAPVRAGQRVSFKVNAWPGSKFDGRVIEVSPSVDVPTRSARVRVAANNANRKLKAGMFAEGEILTGVTGQAILIPSAAVYRDDRSAKDTFVYVAESGKAVRRKVRIGREREGVLEITDGLRAGEMLIAEQSIEVADGVLVEPRK